MTLAANDLLMQFNIHRSCARVSRHFVFSPDEDSCINYRNVGKFLTCFMFLLPVEPAWSLFIEVLASPKQKETPRGMSTSHISQI